MGWVTVLWIIAWYYDVIHLAPPSPQTEDPCTSTTGGSTLSDEESENAEDNLVGDGDLTTDAPTDVTVSEEESKPSTDKPIPEVTEPATTTLAPTTQPPTTTPAPTTLPPVATASTTTATQAPTTISTQAPPAPGGADGGKYQRFAEIVNNYSSILQENVFSFGAKLSTFSPKCL